MASYQVTVIDAEGTETIVEVPDDQYILCLLYTSPSPRD